MYTFQHSVVRGALEQVARRYVLPSRRPRRLAPGHRGPSLLLGPRGCDRGQRQAAALARLTTNAAQQGSSRRHHDRPR